MMEAMKAISAKNIMPSTTDKAAQKENASAKAALSDTRINFDKGPVMPLPFCQKRR